MAIRTCRYVDAPSATNEEGGEAFRVLVCRYRPRGVRKEDETWDAWWPELGPSKELHAAWYGKDGGGGISWDEYRARYLDEMKTRGWWIRGLAERERRGEPIVLMCSSACHDPARCHTSLLKALVEADAAPPISKPATRVLKRQQRA